MTLGSEPYEFQAECLLHFVSDMLAGLYSVWSKLREFCSLNREVYNFRWARHVVWLVIFGKTIGKYFWLRRKTWCGGRQLLAVLSSHCLSKMAGYAILSLKFSGVPPVDGLFSLKQNKFIDVARRWRFAGLKRKYNLILGEFQTSVYNILLVVKLIFETAFPEFF